MSGATFEEDSSRATNEDGSARGCTFVVSLSTVPTSDVAKDTATDSYGTRSKHQISLGVHAITLESAWGKAGTMAGEVNFASLGSLLAYSDLLSTITSDDARLGSVMTTTTRNATRQARPSKRKRQRGER